MPCPRPGCKGALWTDEREGEQVCTLCARRTPLTRPKKPQPTFDELIAELLAGR